MKKARKATGENIAVSTNLTLSYQNHANGRAIVPLFVLTKYILFDGFKDSQISSLNMQEKEKNYVSGHQNLLYLKSS